MPAICAKKATPRFRPGAIRKNGCRKRGRGHVPVLSYQRPGNMAPEAHIGRSRHGAAVAPAMDAALSFSRAILMPTPRSYGRRRRQGECYWGRHTGTPLLY